MSNQKEEKDKSMESIGNMIDAIIDTSFYALEIPYEKYERFIDIEDDYMIPVAFISPSVAYHRNIALNGLYSNAIKICFYIYDDEPSDDDVSEYKIIPFKNMEDRDDMFDLLLAAIDDFSKNLYNTKFDIHHNFYIILTKRDCRFMYNSRYDTLSAKLLDPTESELKDGIVIRLIYDKDVERDKDYISYKPKEIEVKKKDIEKKYHPSDTFNLMITSVIRSVCNLQCQTKVAYILPRISADIDEDYDPTVKPCIFKCVPRYDIFENIFLDFSNDLATDKIIDKSKKPNLVHSIVIRMNTNDDIGYTDYIIFVDTAQHMFDIYSGIYKAIQNGHELFENENEITIEIKARGAAMLCHNKSDKIFVAPYGAIDSEDVITIPAHKDKEIFEIEKSVFFTMTV